MVKRLPLFFALLAVLSFCAAAKPPTIDGTIHLRKEYNETVDVVQSENHESNNNIRYAILYWTSSPEDYSVYLGFVYSCTDFVEGGGLSAVEITVNDVLCGVIHPDNSITELETNLFDMECCYQEITANIENELQCEARVGIKYGLDRPIEVGVRIADCSGIPSNYYRKVVYSPPEPETTHTETTTQKHTTTKKETTFDSKKAERTETAETAVSTSAAPRTTKPVITASPKAEPSATAAETRANPAADGRHSDSVTTTKTKTTKARTTKARMTKTTTNTSTAVSTAASAAAATTSAPESISDASSDARTETSSEKTTAERYRETSKIKSVGSVLVAVLLTSAVFISVSVLRDAKKEKHDSSITPKETHED